MPSDHEIPSEVTHLCSVTIWNPPTPVWNSTVAAAATPRVAESACGADDLHETSPCSRHEAGHEGGAGRQEDENGEEGEARARHTVLEKT